MSELPNCPIRGHNHKLQLSHAKWLHCPTDNYRWEPIKERVMKQGLPAFIKETAVVWNNVTYARHKKPRWGW